MCMLWWRRPWVSALKVQRGEYVGLANVLEIIVDYEDILGASILISFNCE